MTAPLLTAAQVATQLGISARKVYDLAARGDLPSYRIGDSVRFGAADVERFRESCRRVPPRRIEAGPLRSVTIDVRDPESELDRAFQRAGVKPRTKPPGKRAPG